jgi:hypothetical protein
MSPKILINEGLIIGFTHRVPGVSDSLAAFVAKTGRFTFALHNGSSVAVCVSDPAQVVPPANVSVGACMQSQVSAVQVWVQ